MHSKPSVDTANLSPCAGRTPCMLSPLLWALIACLPVDSDHKTSLQTGSLVRLAHASSLKMSKGGWQRCADQGTALKEEANCTILEGPGPASHRCCCSRLLPRRPRRSHLWGLGAGITTQCQDPSTPESWIIVLGFSRFATPIQRIPRSDATFRFQDSSVPWLNANTA